MKINYKNGYTVEVLDSENEKLDDIVMKAYGAMRHTKTINDASAKCSDRKAKKVSDSATFGKKTKKVSDSATFGKKTKKVSDSATFGKKTKKVSDSAYDWRELVYYRHFSTSDLLKLVASYKEAVRSEKISVEFEEDAGRKEYLLERIKEFEGRLEIAKSVLKERGVETETSDEKTKKVSDSAIAKKAKAKDSFTKAFGLPDAEHIVYGDRPGQDELRYNGKIYDYDEIKEQVMDIYFEENENGKVPTDEVLTEWVMSDVANQHAVYHILEVTQPLEEEIEYYVSED